MRRPYLAASLLLAALLGCSSSTPPKSAEEASPSTPLQPVSSSAVASTPAASPPPAPAATPAPPAASPRKPAEQSEDKNVKPPSPAAVAELAKCLSKKGATMYGVFWCDHCREQKEKFGDAFQYVHYVECVTKDAPRVLIPECKAQGITHTPTWIFGDGSRMEGSQPLATLAQKAGCKAP